MPSDHRCLSGETVLALVSGAFDEVRACALLAEADRCADCSFLLHEAGRALVEDGTDGSDTLPWLGGPGVLRVGSIVAKRFRVLRLLGSGGMGEVYEALDNELGELVALKTIRSAHATLPSSVERFRQEVRLARRVVHPHVCRVLEFGRHQVEGAVPVYFLTMELLRGELLSRYLRRRGRLSALESVAIARQICAGLSAIHAQGVLHRDIKPSNVMLCSGHSELDTQGTSGRRAVLLDFGVARSLALEMTAQSGGALIGTPDYMAPEQLQARALTPLTDVYALGMVLFELLVGELPFAEDPTLTRALKRLQGDPTVASTAVAALPPKLRRLLARCLAVAPSERPQSAAALLDELVALEDELSGPPLSSGSPSSDRRAWAITPARMGLAKLLLGFVVLGGIGVMSTRPWQTGRQSAAGASALPNPPSRPAAAPTNGQAHSRTPSATAATVSEPAALAAKKPYAEAPTPRRASEPSAPTPKQARSASSMEGAHSSARDERACSPPYYFDGDGFRVYRRECL